MKGAASSVLKMLDASGVNVFGRTGTAAIRVGCRTPTSPLLPFLIFVDFGGGNKTSLCHILSVRSELPEEALPGRLASAAKSSRSGSRRKRI